MPDDLISMYRNQKEEKRIERKRKKTYHTQERFSGDTKPGEKDGIYCLPVNTQCNKHITHPKPPTPHHPPQQPTP
jgi:hypothetical protein